MIPQFLSMSFNIVDDYEQIFSTAFDIDDVTTLEKIVHSLMRVNGIGHGFEYPVLMNFPNAKNNHQAIFLWVYQTSKSQQWQRIADNDPDAFFSFVLNTFDSYVRARSLLDFSYDGPTH
jgi:hypothetical protein